MILTSGSFGDLMAERIRSQHRDIAERWLKELHAVLPVGENDIFPSDQLLDHIPVLIRELAEVLSAPGGEGMIATNTAVFEKAQELGNLRFSQKASVHQLLREYRLLGTVIGAFVHEQITLLGIDPGSQDSIATIMRLNDAVGVLLQTTVDTFVGRYADTISRQTTRLEGFNRMVSHELRQPLTTVQYALELLKSSDPPVDAAKRERLLQVADRSVARMVELTQKLTTIARLSTGDGPEVQEVDVAQVAQDVARQLADVAAEKAVEIRVVPTPMSMTVDSGRLELVLVNLISNGIKYSDAAKPNRFVEIEALPDAAHDRCLIQVRDNGLGIPGDALPRIFTRFFRAHAALDHAHGTDGLGLGLTIVADCVEAAGGTIAVESVEGDGTTFTMTFPKQPLGTPRRD